MPSTTDLVLRLWDAVGGVAPALLGLAALWLALRALRKRRRDSSRDWRIERAEEQLRAVRACGFERRSLLNREEAPLLPLLERAARDVGQGHRVMAQTSLGEVIRPTGRDTYEALGAINAKRLDFAIFDRRNLIVCAIEYQGTGHYQEGAAFRDSVKREALRKAGVRVLEVHPGFAEAGLMQEVRTLLGAPARA